MLVAGLILGIEIYITILKIEICNIEQEGRWLP